MQFVLVCLIRLVALHARATVADPTSKLRGEAISVLFGSQVSLRLRYCKRDEVYFTTLL